MSPNLTQNSPSSGILDPVMGLSENITHERLVDELARVFSDAEEARLLVERADFPPQDIPSFKTARIFWSLVTKSACDGKVVNGISKIVAHAEEIYPANPVFVSYRKQALVITTPSIRGGVRARAKPLAVGAVFALLLTLATWGPVSRLCEPFIIRADLFAATPQSLKKPDQFPEHDESDSSSTSSSQVAKTANQSSQTMDSNTVVKKYRHRPDSNQVRPLTGSIEPNPCSDMLIATLENSLPAANGSATRLHIQVKDTGEISVDDPRNTDSVTKNAAEILKRLPRNSLVKRFGRELPCTGGITWLP